MLNPNCGGSHIHTILARNLNEARKHDKLLVLVLVAELLAVATLLLLGPADHLRTSNQDKEQHTPAQSTDQVNAQPGNHLEQVVGASHEIEAQADGNTALGGTGAAQVTQDQVRVEVGQFAKDEHRKTRVEEGRVGVAGHRGGIGTEDPVSDVEAG